jgi:hypothetical protein
MTAFGQFVDGMFIPPETLLRQAPMTAHDYMMHAISDIDELLGKGYAAKHPELIAAYMQTAAIDFATGIAVNLLGRRGVDPE